MYIAKSIEVSFQPGVINFPPYDKWLEVDLGQARKRGPDSLWPPTIYLEKVANGYPVEFPEGCFIRLGVSAALVTNKGPVMIEFDSGHPTQAGKLTPPAGIWVKGTPFDASLAELGEEIIIVREDQVGFFVFNGKKLSEDWVRAYAQAHSLEVDDELLIGIEEIKDLSGMTTFNFGNEELRGLVAFEPETGSIEAIFPFKIIEGELPDGAKLVDGEMLPNEKYLDRRVISGGLTTKAQIVLRAFYP